MSKLIAILATLAIFSATPTHAQTQSPHQSGGNPMREGMICVDVVAFEGYPDYRKFPTNEFGILYARQDHQWPHTAGQYFPRRTTQCWDEKSSYDDSLIAAYNFACEVYQRCHIGIAIAAPMANGNATHSIFSIGSIENAIKELRFQAGLAPNWVELPY